MNRKHKPADLFDPDVIAGNPPSDFGCTRLVGRLRAQIDCGFGWLRFNRALEPRFQAYLRASGRWSRIGMLSIALIAVVCSALFDKITLGLPASLVEPTRVLQFGLMLPTLLLAGLGCWLSPGEPKVDILLLILFAAFCVSMIAQRVIDAAHGFDLPIELLSATALGMFTLSRIRFWWLALVTLIAVSVVAVTEVLYVHMELNANYHLFAASVLVIVGVVAGYTQEYFIRWTWLNGMLLHYLSRLDSLTGLLNRQALEQALQRAGAHARREHRSYGLAMIDIDAFGAYNEHYGHPAGDVALRCIAREINAASRRPLDFCGRYGGEEFVVLWMGGRAEELAALAERLRARIERQDIAHARSPAGPSVTVSIGLCHVAADRADVDPQSALAMADRLLYEGKARGRNRAIVDSYSLPADALPRAG